MPRLKMNSKLADKCRRLVFRTAEKYKIPPVYVTAHVRSYAADAARKEVWNVMVNDYGMKRQMVANIFGRDRRRVRASVLRSPAERSKLKPVHLRPQPFQAVGNQFVWSFAVPLEVGPVSVVERFMKPLPVKVKVALSDEEKLRLARHYERESRKLRKSTFH